MAKAKTRARLLTLRKRIIESIFIKRWQDVWFFPEYIGVSGYLGTDRIIFLSINPSTGAFPSKVDNWYYRQLKKNGFANAHLTDVFKQRARVWKELRDDDAARHEARRFLLEEIRIINPRLIVLVGKKYLAFYNDILKGVGIKTMPMAHYAYRYGSAKKLRGRIRREIRKVRGEYFGGGRADSR